MVESEVFERLPKHTTPVNYKLKLQPNLKDFTFTGQVTVLLTVSHFFKSLNKCYTLDVYVNISCEA